MRTIPTIVLSLMLAGATALAAPEQAEARFGAGVIAEAVAGLEIVQPAQHRHQRTRPVSQPPRATATPPTTIESTYRDPTSRGALLNCSFC